MESDAMSDVAATCNHDGRLSKMDSDLVATGMQLKPWEHELFQAVAGGSFKTASDILSQTNRIFSQKTLDDCLLEVCKLHKESPTYFVENLISLGANMEVISKDGCTPLIIAANNGNIDLLTFLLRRGADVNAVTSEGESALTLSIRPNRSLGIMKLLLQQREIDKNHKNHQGYTALMKAIEARDIEVMKLLIDDHKLHISVRLTEDKESFVSNETIIERFGQALFDFASRAGMVKVIKLLLCTRYGQCPFMEAALRADLELIKILIDSQFCNVHKEDSGDTTYLQNFFQTKKERNLAIGDVDITVVQLLLENGAAVNESEKRSWGKQSCSVPPVITAVEAGSLGLVQLMCTYGAKLDVKAKYQNKTPLDVAAESGKADILQFLLERHDMISGQSGEVTNKRSALCLCLMNKHVDCAKIILKHGYNIELDIERFLPSGASIKAVSALIAVITGDVDLLRFFLQEGADVNSITAEGDSALTLSIRPNRSLDIIKLLLRQRGIDKNYKNQLGYTALMKAVDARDIEVMKLLIDDYKSNNREMLTISEDSVDGDETIMKVFGQELLDVATRAGMVKVIKLLLQIGHRASPLMEAAVRADSELVKILIDSQFYDIHKEDSGDNTFLQNFFQTKKQRNLAIDDVDIPVVQLLLENGAAVNGSQKRSWFNRPCSAPVITAVETGSLGLVQLMCKYGARLDVTSNSKTPLDVAAESGKADILQFLLNKNAHAISSDHNKTARFEQSALHLCLMNGHTDCAEILLKHGYMIDVPSAAEYAIDYNKPEYLKFLLQRYRWDVRSFLLNHKYKRNKLLTPAVMNDYVDIISSLVEARMYVPYFLLSHARSAAMVQVLVRHGANVNHRAKQTGDSVLLTLIQSYHKNVTSVVEIVKVLLEKGANVNSCNFQMLTPVIAAARKWDSSELLNTLLTHGADVNTKDCNGSTAFLYAVEKNFTENAKFLIEFEGNQKVNIEMNNTSGSTPLLLAVKNRNKTITELLIARGADVNVEDLDGNTALTMVARYGDADTLKKIVERGADINHQNKAGCSALMVASMNRLDVSPLNILLSNAANVNIKDNMENTALMHAVEQGHTEAAKLLIEHVGDQKTDFDVLNLSGSTALLSAVKLRNKTITDLLIARGANVNIEDKNGDTALTLLAKDGDTDTMKKVIDTGANINHQNKKGYSALMFAARKYSDVNPLKLLLLHGASVNIKDNMGNTALLHAVEKRHTENAKILIAHQSDQKVDVDIQNISGATALMLAVKHTDKTIINMLIDQRADVNVQDQNGDTALTLAARNSDTDTLMKIIKSGADINHQNKEGYSAMMFASQKYSNVSSLTVLLQNGASVNIKDNMGNTALLHAIDQRHTEMVKSLIAYQGDQKLDVDAQNTFGTTALILATKRRMEPIIDLLIAQGANVNLEDKNGDNALTSAAVYGESNTIKKLIKRGVCINHQNKEGYSALMSAACNHNRQKDSMEALLKAGADVNVVSYGREKKTAISLLFEAEDVYDKSTVYFLMDSLLDKGASSSYLKPDALFDLIRSKQLRLIPKLVSTGFGPPELSSEVYLRCQSERVAFPVVSPFMFALLYLHSKLAHYFDGNWFLSTSDIQLQAKHDLVKEILERRSNEECVEILDEFCSQPMSLLKLSFVAVSSAIGCVPGREERVEKLPLPPLIKDKLLFKRQEVHLDIPESATPSRESSTFSNLLRLQTLQRDFLRRLTYRDDDDDLYHYVDDSDDDYNPYDYFVYDSDD